MKVRSAIEHLQKLNPEAELMISAPFACSKGVFMTETSSLDVPVRAVRTGSFYPTGLPWVMFVGTDVWGLDQGIEE